MDKCQPSTKWARRSLIAIFSILPCLSPTSQAQSPVNLSHDEALRIGHKIWKNECGGSISGLTSWNSGENFASLGIGHFIWYPQNARGPFEESFPKFIDFAINHRADMPTWLRQTACPWNSRTEFLRAQDSPRMKELRAFLARTVDLQTQFMVTRLQNALPKMLDEAPPDERDSIRRQFDRLAGSANGCYALVDYVNFKGEGTLQTERYHDQGWGLLQVLEGMQDNATSPSAAEEFSRSAAQVLKRRVQNSPPERNESRWLPGWINRVKTYAGNS
ncbi:MAG TPA: hypothetical protein VEI58_07730 [Chthoniobacterales bacterium]|nr:hypothetical protein [Chthoniobacterales bacterium]